MAGESVVEMLLRARKAQLSFLSGKMGEHAPVELSVKEYLREFP
jgi:hypothetical protein